MAKTEAAVAEKLAAARNTEAIIAASYVNKLREQAQATNDTTEATLKQIEAAQKSATAKQTEFERTDALAKAKRIEAEASKVQGQALQDNSARVGEYRAAVDAAARDVERLTELHKTGLATDAQVVEAKTKLAGATKLYRDALEDAAKKAEVNLAAQQRAAALAQASISVDLERVKAAREVALAQGDVAAASQLATQATDLQVQASRAMGDAARNEAQAIRELADKKEAEYRATGAMTEAQKNDIAARRQAADLKDLEAQKSDILTSKILALADANRSETATLEAKNAALERNISAQERANDLAERAAALIRKRDNVDKEGFVLDKNGQRLTGTSLNPLGAYNKVKEGGGSEALALRLSNDVQDGKYRDNRNGTFNYNKFFEDLSAAILEEKNTAALKDSPEAKRNQALVEARKTATPSASGESPTNRSTGSTVNHEYTVNIRADGKTAAISVTSENDAKALLSILQQSKLGAGY